MRTDALEVCLLPGHTTGELAVRVLVGLAEGNDFERIKVDRVGGRGHNWAFTDRNVDRVRSFGEALNVVFRSANAALGISEQSEMTRIYHYSPNQLAVTDLMLTLGLPDLQACLLGDFEDRRWQSETDVRAYEQFRRDHSHLPIIESPPYRWVDVTGNPGRWKLMPGMVLWPAAHMWLGPVAIEYFGGVEHLLAFDDVPVRVMNGLVEIELYSVDDSVPLIRQRQRSFRDWVGMDDLESNPERWIKPGDPAVHLDRKIVDGVARTVMTQWFDADGELTKRSKAVVGRRAVIADDGVQISSVEIAP